MDNNNPWYVLKIEKTDDKEAVKRAYMKELPKYNPEDDPEGFRDLRAAYESALEQIDEDAQDKIDNTPVGLFIQKAAYIYNDFAKRRDVTAWKELLQDDICERLDTEDMINHKLLAFFMEHSKLPAVVWRTLNAKFNWSEKKNELKKVFPPGFIDYILYSMDYDYLDYNLFELSGDIDRYIHLFNEAERVYYNNNNEEFTEKLEEITALGVKHPSLDLLKARLCVTKGENEEALNLAKRVFLACPNDFAALTAYAEILQLFNREDYTKEALTIYKKMNETQSTYYRAMAGVTGCLIALEEYEEAHAFLREAINIFSSDMFALTSYLRVTEILTETYEKKYKEDPSDYETAITLCKHYLNLRKCDESYKILLTLKDPGDDPRYYEYLGDCLSERGEYDKAVEYARKGIELDDDDARAHINLIEALIGAGRYDEALKQADDALRLEKTEQKYYAVLHGHKGRVYASMKLYDDAIKEYDTALLYSPSIQPLHISKAKVCRDSERLAEAARACEDAIRLIPVNPEPYAVLMDVYTDAEQPEDALLVFSRAAEYNLDTIALKYFKACALLQQSKFDETMEVIESVLNAECGEEDAEYKLEAIALRGEVYYKTNDKDKAHADFIEAIEAGVTRFQYPYDRLIHIYGNAKEYAKALSWVKRKLEVHENYSAHLDEAWFCGKLGMREKAEEILLETAAAYPDASRVRWRLAKHYESLGDYKKAIEHYKVITDKDPDRPDVIDEIANCMAELLDRAGAIKLLSETLKEYPDNLWLYARRGYIYTDDNKPAEALSDLLRAVSDTAVLGECWDVDDVFNNIGHLYEEYLNNAPLAQEYYEKALEINPDDAYALGCIGDIGRYYHKNYEGALKLYNRCIELEPDNPSHYQKRGELPQVYNKDSRADYERALRYYLADISNDPVNACAHLNAAKCYMGLSNHKKAFEHFNKAIEYAKARRCCPPGECHEALFGLCKYYALKQDNETALKYLEEAIQAANAAEYSAYKSDLTK